MSWPNQTHPQCRCIMYPVTSKPEAPAALLRPPAVDELGRVHAGPVRPWPSIIGAQDRAEILGYIAALEQAALAAGIEIVPLAGEAADVRAR